MKQFSNKEFKESLVNNLSSEEFVPNNKGLQRFYKVFIEIEGIKYLLLQNNFQKKPCQDLELEVIFQESRTKENKIRYTEKRNRCMSPLRS